MMMNGMSKILEVCELIEAIDPALHCIQKGDLIFILRA
jgi:hypothetical protein